MPKHPHRGMFSQSAGSWFNDPTGTNEPERKRQRGSESFSSDEEADGPCTKFSKDSDAISVTASEDEVQNLLDGVSRGSSTKTTIMKAPKTTMKFLRSWLPPSGTRIKRVLPSTNSWPKWPTNVGARSLNRKKCRASWPNMTPRKTAWI